MNPTARLHAVLAALAPILGVSVGTRGEGGSVRIDYDQAATPAQQTAAQNALASFDWSDAAQAAWEADQYPERKALRAQAAQAIADAGAYAALASPTAAQTAAYMKKVAQALPVILRRLVQLD